MDRASVAKELYRIGAVRLDGPYTLKSGLQSPYYLDLRVLISHPQLLNSIADIMWQSIQPADPFQCICGVPYTALPIATAISIAKDLPMVMRRKEAKAYGTKKRIEGTWKQGDNCLVVEDLVTSGMSVFETIEPLKSAGLQVTDVVVLVDRQQGGRNNLEKNGIRLHSVFTVSEILHELHLGGLVSQDALEKIGKFIEDNQVVLEKPRRLSFKERSSIAKNPVAKNLFQLIESKKSNLCLSIDLCVKEDILRVVEAVGPYVCLVKTHADIISGFDSDFIAALKDLSKKHSFLIFEDRKFADIGNTVSLQYSQGVHRIVEWADLTNAHCISGEGVIKGIAKCGLEYAEPRGLLLMAQMSSEGNLMDETYVDRVWKMASSSAFVCGFICQQANLCGSNSKVDPGYVYMTPGVQIGSKKDTLGQQYREPEDAIARDLCDVIIVGRGIFGAKDPVAAAKEYRDRAWHALGI